MFSTNEIHYIQAGKPLKKNKNWKCLGKQKFSWLEHGFYWLT